MNLAEGRPSVVMPGVMTLESGTERYRVRGGGATVIALAAGDTVEVIDPEGRQAVEVAVFDDAGRSDPAMIEMSGAARGNAIVSLAAARMVDARRVRTGLERRGIDLSRTQSVLLSTGDTAAGTTFDFTASLDLVCVVAAPGGPMLAHEQNPPTDLIIFVHRKIVPDRPDLFLPPPLADPSQDFRIDRATAMSYEVRAGDFIQIVDIEGRQCSDFQTLQLAQLELGVENTIDGTTTRSLIGASYPGPGLYSKFFDASMQPVVEVVQDTVGRHDTFNLACSAKYYDDMGYPGHVNCTDNINAELERYDVAPRRGWEAINFFYNTNVDAMNQIYLDEPWSRPGDYVMLRALTDLVCVSTACPCDVDAANGWDPTDIQIRVYPGGNTFEKAKAYRMTPDAEATLTKETGFHTATSKLTRKFVDYQGYWLADSYTGRGAIEEYWSCREAAAMIDLSPLRKYEVVGPGAESLLQSCLTRNVRKLSDGQVGYTAMCYDTGGMIDDGTIFRLGPENFRWIGGNDKSGLWLREKANELGLRAWVKNSTDQLHNIAVQGPLSRDILREVIWTRPDQAAIDELGWFRFSIGRLGGPDGQPLVVSRTGYTGELGYEVFCHPTDGPIVWDTIFQAGQAHDVLPLGLAALDMLRIEAGLIFAGQEFDDQIDPFEAGIGFAVQLDSTEEGFVGREALSKRRENPQRCLVGLEVDGGEVASAGDPVRVGHNQVGVVTSSTRSPILAKNIALCRMAVEHSPIGTEVQIGKLDGEQKLISATVVRFPFYDPDKLRVRGISEQGTKGKS